MEDDTKKLNTYKKDGITYVTLDESILDIDSWLPKEAIQQVVDAIKRYEKKKSKENKTCSYTH